MEKTESEKWDFLEALYEHGSDVEVLANALPTWSKGQIEHTAKRFRFRAKRKLENDEKDTKDGTLNQWVKVIEHLHQVEGSTNHPWWRKGRKKADEVPRDHVPLISKTLMYAACFEDHYKGSHPEDPNYSEIYKYLAQLIEGNEPTQLSPGSAAKVLEMLNKIKKVVMDESGLKNLQYLQKPEISFLPPIRNSNSQSKKVKVKTEPVVERSGAESPELSCPLFQDEEEEVKVVSLEPCDPYYELKLESAVKRIHASQQIEAASFKGFPGVNPMEVPISRLVKPSIALKDPENL